MAFERLARLFERGARRLHSSPRRRDLGVCLGDFRRAFALVEPREQLAEPLPVRWSRDPRPFPQMIPVRVLGDELDASCSLELQEILAHRLRDPFGEQPLGEGTAFGFGQANRDDIAIVLGRRFGRLGVVGGRNQERIERGDRKRRRDDPEEPDFPGPF